MKFFFPLLLCTFVRILDVYGKTLLVSLEHGQLLTPVLTQWTDYKTTQFF